MEHPAKRRKIQKICTLWTHDKTFSESDVVFNLDKFPELELNPGSLAKVVALGQNNIAVRDFQQTPQNVASGAQARSGTNIESTTDLPASDGAPRRERRASLTVTIDENGSQIQNGRPVDAQRAYVFVVQDATAEQKSKHTSLYISVSAAIATALGFRSRMQVVVAKADSAQWASHVEITFRDEYLARSDMWRMAINELANRTVYKDQKLMFMGTIKATVKQVYIDGQRRKSGYFTTSTKPIFRSESARYVLFIQMSKEMWEFDAQGSGEIMFNKVINGFLPDLFKKWTAISARHLVTIVLFSRIEYDRAVDEPIMETVRQTGKSQDFYRVVVSDMSSGDWIKILYQLKREFRTFLRDVTINKRSTGSSGSHPDSIITGKPSSASKGNILEAINLASAQYSKDYIDRDLVRTGISIVIITAGSGIFEVDYSMLKLTTDTLIGSGIGLDLVSLAPMPLHSVPLFRYRNPRFIGTSLLASLSQSLVLSDAITDNSELESHSGDDGWRYAMPHWVDISFWTGSVDEGSSLVPLSSAKKSKSGLKVVRDSTFNVRCNLYELQMMGIMENDMSNISIELMHDNDLHPWHKLKNELTGLPVTKVDRGYLRKLDKGWMDQYDDDVFGNDRITQSAQQNGSIKTTEVDNAAAAVDDKTVSEDSSNEEKSTPNRNSFLDWRLKATTATRPPGPRRKTSNASLLSNAESGTFNPTKLLRQISFGGAGFGASKAVASTEVVFASSTAAVPTFTREGDKRANGENISGFTKKIKASLNRPVPRPSTPTTASSKDSDPSEESRSQPIAIGRARTLERTQTKDVAGSQDTIKELGSPGKGQKLASVSSKDSSAILYAASASQRAGPRPALSSSGDALPVSKALSPTSALAPWLVLVNPCNPKKNDFDVNSQFRRWQHVFPKPLRTSSMKWKSLCSPASVPLTNEYFPTAAQLADEYHESPYNLSPNMEDSNLEPSKVREILIRELISSRLSHGFQFIVGRAAAEFLGVPEDDLANIFNKDYMSKDGDAALMSVGNAIHQIVCAAGNEVQVRRFNRKSPLGMESTAAKPFTVTYKPYIRTALAKDYELAPIALKPPRLEYNWNFIDTFLAGYHHDMSDTLRFWRARFVLIPVNLPKNRRTLPVYAEDTAEELRLEGIYKLTQIWQRHRVLDEEPLLKLRTRKTKDANPLAIEYQTRDPSTVVAAGPESSLLLDQDGAPFVTQIFNETEPYETSNIDIQKLAQDLQGERGIKMLDRRWHWRLHYNCFVGFDLTSWLLQNFRDIESREEAVDIGNQLMERGLFHHVQKKHAFRDGQYFYQIASEYRVRPESKAGWFRTPRTDKSVPHTPLAEITKNPLGTPRPTSRPSTSSSASSGEKTPTKEEPTKRKVELGRCLRYDLDPRKRSYRPEVINLHYDRLHNPDNCYHIRLDWMNVTAKLIEDAIVTWASTVERYGLRLVEVPISEASAITDSSPFRSPYIVKLAEPPPPTPSSAQYFDTTSFTPHLQSDKYFYHKAVLRKLDFVLDAEAVSNFPTDIEVSYSWGKPTYRFMQYIHKSGVLLVQITGEGDFLLLANRLYNNRAVAAKDFGKFDKREDENTQSSRRFANTTVHTNIKDKDPGRWSPFASPLVRAAPGPEPLLNAALQHSTEHSPNTQPDTPYRTAEQIKDIFESHCNDVQWLRAFYQEALKPRASPSPHLAPVPDEKIPSLGLPPSLTTRSSWHSPVLQARSGRESAASRISLVSSGTSGGSESGTPQEEKGPE
ncbi:hypothetical protein NA57DRAFT_52416 [Rhizodiscina lignyota]|uniref:Vacuolar membrane-associated protein IML1 n=1 Tax=Rhizodiscina lignyota TaxID=1504668 RepID=A0A9P4IP84_9PEZI|nr:hypothetical protein NA57DRAFT_52416 [Rhizodiscina lignyota]